MTISPAAHAAVLDLRAIPHGDRHALVFDRFDALRDGESMQLLNDHDPQPLRRQFEARAPGRVAWTPEVSGPTVWQVRITRVAATKASAAAASAAAEDSCCSGGACCG